MGARWGMRVSTGREQASRRGCVGVLLGVLVLAGCLAGGGQVSGPTPVAAETGRVSEVVAEEVAPAEVKAGGKVLDELEIVCGRAVRCGTIGRSELAECRKGPGQSRLTRVWGYDEMLGIPGLVAQGRLREVPERKQECLEYLAGAPCRISPEYARKGCFGGVMAFRMLAPAVAPGGKCTRWDECIDGFCTAQTACEGVCMAKAKVGEACEANQVCVEDAFCWEGTCRAREGVGAVCGGHWQWCQDGLFCDGYRPAYDDAHYAWPARDGVCSAGRQLGESCVPTQSSQEICAAGLFCDWGVDAPVCSARRDVGEECRWDDACGDGLVCVGLELGGFHPAGNRYATRKAGKCGPALDAGEPCEPRAFVSGCPASMVCDAKTRVCRSSGHAGDPCESSWITKPHAQDVPRRNEGCVSGHYCDVKTRVCTRQILKGERCRPQEFGVEDDPCFLGKCDAKTRRCVVECKQR